MIDNEILIKLCRFHRAEFFGAFDVLNCFQQQVIGMLVVIAARPAVTFVALIQPSFYSLMARSTVITIVYTTAVFVRTSLRR